jgi:hypothetical protein
MSTSRQSTSASYSYSLNACAKYSGWRGGSRGTDVRVAIILVLDDEEDVATLITPSSWGCTRRDSIV